MRATRSRVSGSGTLASMEGKMLVETELNTTIETN